MKLLIATLLLLSGAAQAQTVWRCGADSRSYSDSPCPEGRVVAVADARTAADVSTARVLAEREQTLARQLAQQNKLHEAQPPVMAGFRQSQPAPVVVKTAKKPSKKASKPSPAAPGTWRATAPASR